MSGLYSHTHHILQKWAAPTVVLNVSFFTKTTLCSSTVPNLVPFFFFCFCFCLCFGLCVFGEPKKKKKNNTKWRKRSNGDNCAFCVVILCEYLLSHTEKPLSWQLFSAIRCALCLGVEVVYFRTDKKKKNTTQVITKKSVNFFSLDKNGMFFVNQHYLWIL